MLTRHHPLFPGFCKWLAEECFNATQIANAVARPDMWLKQFEEYRSTLANRVPGWVYEDELDHNVSQELFALSRVIDGVRMYPLLDEDFE